MEYRLSRKGLFHLCLLYTVWSTTYLAMRIGVGFESGFPPFLFALLRMPVAACILLVIARGQGLRLKPTRREWVSLVMVGNLLWVGGHGLILWAAQYADSGFICLMASSVPIWAAAVDLVVYKKRPSLSLAVSLLMGFSGMALLSSSFPTRGAVMNITVVLVLTVAPLCWSLGSVVQSRHPVNLAPHVMSGYHHLVAAGGFLILTLFLKEPLPHPTTAAWIAWAYLVIFGSVIAFTSFVFTLKLLPINIVMTYAYVNPVIALFLGWIILGEPITGRMLAGAALVLASVFAIFKTRRPDRPRPSTH